MNLTDAESVSIGGKSVRSILLNGRLVYEKVSMSISTNKEFIVADEVATVSLESDLKSKEVELFKVIGMTRTSLGSKSTGSDGKASWSYTGTGAGLVGFVAVYDDKDSNIVRIDDYTPSVTTVTLSADKSSSVYKEAVTFTANVVDQHGQPISSGTVTFKADGTLIGSRTISSGTATLTTGNINAGNHNITAEINSVMSNSIALTVSKATPTISLVSDKSLVEGGDSFTLSGTFSVDSGASLKLYDGQTLVGPINSFGGVYSKTITNAVAGTHNYTVVFEGNDNYESVTSSSVEVTVVGIPMVIGITGSSFSTSVDDPFVYTGQVFVDWDDGTTVEYTGGSLSHTYASSGDYSVKVYGLITEMYGFQGCTELTSITLPNSVTSLGNNCFAQCTSLTSVILSEGVTSIGNGCFYECTSLTTITIPESVTSIGSYCFRESSGLTEIVLNWDSASEIVTYNSNWLPYFPTLHFLVPDGTKALYEAKSYPSNLLKEVGEVEPASIDLTGTKSILSFADSEQSVLTATVLDENEDPIEGVDVNLYNGSTLWDTLTTGSDGTVSKTYTSQGSGDIVFTAEVDGTLLTKTFVIHDYWYYTSTAPSRSSTDIGSGYYNEIFDTPINLPSAFELEYTGSITSSGDKMGTIILGETTDNFYYNGTNQRNLICAISRNGSRAVLSQKQNIVPSTGSMTIKLTYSNGVHTISYGSETLTVSNSEYTPSKLLGFFITKNNTVISEIKVKPL